MDFNIGDRVRIKRYEDISDIGKYWGWLCGKNGEIVDKLWSGAKGCAIYKIHIDGYDKPSSIDFPETAIDLVQEIEKVSYDYQFEYLDNVVVARLYKVTETSRTEIAKGHGHIIHDGAEGIAQAASYALRKIYFNIAEK